MTRECNADFDQVKIYIENYSIDQNLKKNDYVSSLKLMHKCYFSSITWHAELHHNKPTFLATAPCCNEDIMLRLVEVVSDLGSSLFNWANGNYKASRVMLRVAIENFIRAISAVEEKDQLLEKNVSKLFEKASSQTIFSNKGDAKNSFNSLHSDYKLLCEDAHTATIQNMEHLSSLSDLPAYETEKSVDSAKIYIRVCKNITAIFCIIFNSFFHQMHHRNKENILNCLSRDVKSGITAPASN
jgi:hypothetical protein